MRETIHSAQQILLQLQNNRLSSKESAKMWNRLGSQGFEALAFLFHREDCQIHLLILSQLTLFKVDNVDKKALLLICMIGLENEDHRIRKQSVSLLGKYPDVTLTNTLLMAAMDPHNEVRIAAIHAFILSFEAFYNEELEQVLTICSNCLFDADPAVRWASAKALHIFLAPNTIPFLTVAVKEEQHPQIKGVIAHTLVLLGEENIGMPILLQNLTSKNVSIQKKSIQALTDVANPETIPRLQNTFDQTPHKKQVIEALGACGNTQAYNFLINLYQSEKKLTATLMLALEKLHSTEDANRYMEIVKNQSKTDEPEQTQKQHTTAFWQLGNLRGQPTRFFLCRCLANSSEDIRRLAVLSLFRRQERIGIQAVLLHYLSEESENVRMEVLECIRKYGVPKPCGVVYNEVLFASLIDPNDGVCYQGLTTLEAIGYPTHFANRLDDFNARQKKATALQNK